jgi:hypothetical protein
MAVAAFPVGGMVVRTSSDMSGKLLELTFMASTSPATSPRPATSRSASPTPPARRKTASGFVFGVATAHR